MTALPCPGVTPGATSREATVHALLPAEPSQVGVARRLIRAGLDRWGVGDDAGESAVLLVSELVTNAILHGQPPVELLAYSSAGSLHIEVVDSGAGGGPDLVPMTTFGDGGRGLHLVEAIADRWGSATSDEGTLVWFEIDRSA